MLIIFYMSLHRHIKEKEEVGTKLKEVQSELRNLQHQKQSAEDKVSEVRHTHMCTHARAHTHTHTHTYTHAFIYTHSLHIHACT